jgi:hypothetical protein
MLIIKIKIRKDILPVSFTGFFQGNELNAFLRTNHTLKAQIRL